MFSFNRCWQTLMHLSQIALSCPLVQKFWHLLLGLLQNEHASSLAGVALKGITSAIWLHFFYVDAGDVLDFGAGADNVLIDHLLDQFSVQLWTVIL